MQQHEIRKVCAKFWAMIFLIIMVAGVAIGMVGKNYMKAPPYMKLIEDSHNTELTETVKQLSTKVEDIDKRVEQISKTIEH